MKSIFLLGCAIASATAIVTRDLPFIKTLSAPQNFIDYEKPYTYYGVSRCEFSNSTRPNLRDFQRLAGHRWECSNGGGGAYNFCVVASTVTDMTSIEFSKVTVELCNRYNGFLQIQVFPPDYEQQQQQQ
ncbi:hypothetical protein BGZ80_008373 [Entomortierella chlamydospora]|uniref:Uncharacterized protein n=1 Tax=Entomortierella chlamydospora TaxID=101097 RepID=A0A9P6MXB6_9FUNG|nr:hypothetical protein BGZ79_005411 [Entomortierella chlamydospora]KAG0017353.1 hypothetical protein BGZ80_008373 [Entomortierella chlamydospora]